MQGLQTCVVSLLSRYVVLFWDSSALVLILGYVWPVIGMQYSATSHIESWLSHPIAWKFEPIIIYLSTPTIWWSCWEVMGVGHRHSWGRWWSEILWMRLARLWPHLSVFFFFWFGQNWHNFLSSRVAEFSLQSHYTSDFSWYCLMLLSLWYQSLESAEIITPNCWGKV